jgi:hypothetical protein
MDQYNGHLASLDWQPTRATLRSFGLALASLCIARAVWRVSAGDWNALLAGSGVAIACLAVWRPSLFRAPYVVLGVLSYPMRWLVAFLTLAALYFAVLTPVACILRLTRRSAGAAPSAWRISPPRGDKASYFRQF